MHWLFCSLFTVADLHVAIPNLYFSIYLYLYSPKSIFADSSSTSRNVDTKFSYVWVFLSFTSDKKTLIFIILISRQCELFLRTAAGIPKCTWHPKWKVLWFTQWLFLLTDIFPIITVRFLKESPVFSTINISQYKVSVFTEDSSSFHKEKSFFC